ncbi:sugar O-acetyltransferase [Clostridium sp.]|uniref:sugar O-acetyltransferase n=1 Tax=Clostridium sp. TaxID=1506 RepID=UPI003464B8EB
MTEREKMINGEFYDAGDEELIKLRKNARRLTRLFNNTTEEEGSKKKEILKELLGGFQGELTVELPFACDYGVNIYMGKDVFINFDCVILDCAPVNIGDNVLIAPNVRIYTATHPIDPITRKEGIEYAKPITIGNNVWIGGGVIITPGVTIGDNSVIGAGSVVTKDIPANMVAVGNPCRVIKSVND